MRARARLLDWLSGHPVDLAVFRITVMAVVLFAAEVHQAPRYAALPPDLRTPPWGFAWAAPILPSSAEAAAVLKWLLLASAALSLLGLFTRFALAVTCALLLLVLALPQQWGSGVHTHHLLWFSLLLLGSPCGDALSLDAWRRPPARPTPLAYGIPLRAAWIVIGLIFVFPGLWKISAQGFGWALSDNLLHQLRFKWLEHGRVPFVRLDLFPNLLRIAGVAVLLLELTLLPLLLWKRTRLVAAAAALTFHLATHAFFFINFSSLWLCYAVFLPWSRWLESPKGAQSARVRAIPELVMGTAVVAAVTVAGALGLEHGWPFSCYPTFRHDPGPEAPVLIVEEESKTGTRTELDRSFLRGASGQKEWSAMWQLLRAPEPSLLLLWWRAHRVGSQVDVRRVTFFLGTVPIEPEAWASPARRVRALTSTEL